MAYTWLTLKEYAEKKGITVQTARRKVTANTIKHKKENGKIYVLQNSEKNKNIALNLDAEYTDILKEKQRLENDLRRQKYRNVQQDILLKKARLKQTMERNRRDYAEGVLSCFIEAFSSFKSAVIQLKLNREQTEILLQSFSKSIDNFQSLLKDYLQKNRDQDDEEDKLDTIEE